jgi:ABC-type multidrug transport system fused ATPase/permease subunit
MIGPSGSGKSTICDLTMRLFDPDSGNITLDGIDLKTFKKEWLGKQITLISQDIQLFHTSIFENIRFSDPDASDADIIKAAKAACIYDFIQSLPKGFHTEVGDRGVRLSGGQKQRVSIARCLLLKPRILIMDEATAYLDTMAEKELKQTLDTLMKGKTIIVISHRVSTIHGADKIIAMDETGIRYEGSSRDFFNNENEAVYRQFQMGEAGGV